MRVVIDEDIPIGLTSEFEGDGHEVHHVEDLGLKGVKNGKLLAAIMPTTDVFVTGDTNLGYQQNLDRLDLAIILVRPPRKTIEQIRPLIPDVIASYETAPKHAVTTITAPTSAQATLDATTGNR